jgi:Protein of unknown function (DUF3305)
VEKPKFSIAVVMQRRPAKSQWADVIWEPHGVVPGDSGGGKKLIVDRDGVAQWLHPAFDIELHRDEAEGYYLNLTAPDPRVFILWRMDGDEGLPVHVTVSSEEASRWMDGGHSVDSVKMPREVFAWVGEWVEKNYKPKPFEKRIKPRSFLHPKDRV